MTKITIDQVKNLREKTGAPVIRVKKVLEEVAGNETRAFKLLQKEGFEKAAKRQGRETGQGVIATYLHHNKKIVGVVELLCETDFVARNEMFSKLADELAMQVASLDPKNADELMDQDYIRDTQKKISDLVKEVIAKTGENVRIGRIYRIELGDGRE
ncbi:hypothetical protein A2630_03745 [Candidatus Woesebacteria bacterium RIFCSPHIGHO2_01_FULL_44_10]|uniref:Elongation factor Ts n=1 Tax=Candidatus Woesebacteria bacterium RIFCSPLOWO2_01_FULL_44_14 TaxID=1802525 RepID=A0A1F8C3P7_9BACT|nr:MAG: hypothetical protein A2630_03745 [Candidatus Woesebacteria bacterium RIFCSPHIGHO2_01_FULL_44_10]OGM55634.1 MAG: hypothetical protein A3F62_02375 [Candidatus Woesebacteria bacterium RIFCSPHIGHO2_12_FULL_44_11]OGM70907.1 MAG: hypothetical protein A2975_01365 [Candidatus Woesebacteria bacterium RIFCSPLOWO2_01_FULL_44_14]